MRYFAIVALFAAIVVALPTDDPKPPKPPGHGDGGNDYEPCPSSLFGNAQCCATDVLGVIGLDCGNRRL